MYYKNFLRAVVVEIGLRRNRIDETKILLQLLRGVDGRILEVGSNLGYLAGLIAEKTSASVVGIDTNPSKLVFAIAKWRTRGRDAAFFRINGTSTYFPKNAFDRVIVSHVIEHFENPDSILQEAKRVLKSTGKILVAVPKEKYLGQLTPDHKLLFRGPDDLRKVLSASGLSISRLVDLPKSIIAECQVV